MRHSRLKKLAEQYIVHQNHDEVTEDLQGSLNDHHQLLEDDQNCVEKITDMDELDKLNTGDCNCDLCEKDGKPFNTLLAENRIMKRIHASKK